MSVEKRPWGHYEVLYKDENTQIKRIEVSPHARFSLQKHLKRAEKWIVIAGEGVATLGDREIRVGRESLLDVPKGEIHRMHNTGSTPLVLIEVQFGNYLEEDDIVRFADDFGRK